MLMLRFLSILGFLLILAAPAAADVFQVRDLKVDETGATGAEAREKAIAQARYRGAQILLDRLTLPEDRAAATQPIQVSDIARFGYKIERQAQDKLTASRFIGELSVIFEPKSVREYLDARGVPFVETQAAKALLAPYASGGLDLEFWRAAWGAAGNNTVLVPYATSQSSGAERPAWDLLAQEAAQVGATRAIIAEGYPQAGGIMVRLTELKAGQAEAQIGTVGPFPDAANAQAGAIKDLERRWKAATVVRTSGVTSMSAVAAFRDMSDWLRIRKGIEQSRMIRDLKIESLSSIGADLSFMFAGRPDQLAADLRSRGLILNGADSGWMLEAAAAP